MHILYIYTDAIFYPPLDWLALVFVDYYVTFRITAITQ